MDDYLRNPWVWAAGVGIGLLLVMRGGSGRSGPDYGPIIETNALAAQTSVALSQVQAKVADSAYAYRAKLAEFDTARYLADAGVYRDMINNTSTLLLQKQANDANFKRAELSYGLGLQTLETTLARDRIAADVAIKNADRKYAVDTIIANQIVPLAQVQQATTLAIANRQAASSENIARINADAQVRMTQRTADRDETSDILSTVSRVLPFFF